MSDYKAKMHLIRFPVGFRHRSRWGAYSAPRSPAVFKRGLLLREGRDKGRGGEGKRRIRKKEKEAKRRGAKGKGGRRR